MGNAPSMAKPTALATYTDLRNSSTCADTVSDDECYRVVLGSKWHNWYWADIMFGQSATWFYLAGIGFFTLYHLWSLLRKRVRYSGLQYNLFYIWSTAMWGYLSSRQLRIHRNFGYTLTFGETVIVLAMILFFAVMTLAPQPYYWPNTMDFGGSPPIATRAGYLAIAILPFQVMFATKWNPITILTGVSHERLQVYHRWSGWIMYVLALVHTFPFIIVDVEMGMMEETWKTDFYTFSGVICLIPHTILVLFSIAVIRDRFYETFKSIHFIMAAWFIVMLFLHCGFTLTSAYYFVGFAVTYALSLIVRWGIVLRNGFHHRAHIDLLDQDMLLVSIPTTLEWKPGQHYFFRFLTRDLHALTSHPFTVATSPARHAAQGESRMKLYIKKHRGMTEGLFEKAEGGDVGVVLDGPYGGINGDLGDYERVLLIAGGSGGSFISSALQDLLDRHSSITCKEVTVVYACRTLADSAWFLQSFLDLSRSSDIKVNLFFHVSSSATTTQIEKSPAMDDANEKLIQPPSPTTSLPFLTPSHSTSLPAESTNNILPNRPNLSQHVRELTAFHGTAGVAVCGPKEMAFDVRNTVAGEQLKIFSGNVGCSELFLHTEAFGW
ncbi:hypothetical protein L202_03904 [Cryptococcus amylolentus CBS 6039]|uniref:ferric-chelate reductase (NADPH) n=1 Tax=Cryptococcus amylolentus CBS 6039 TaxID=1295533 RepID=A0A1E3HV54_9TREE|nr:hypothetical protein L202_03904 [Cryptococcus amylolentus CBS 6039]ODN80045.1 hypothetical protein L202_03904 [Cryptococcus amylolentus CBS 6039]